MEYHIKNKIGCWKSMCLGSGVVAFTCLACGCADSKEVRDSVQHRIDTHIHLYDTRREGSSTFLDPVIHEKIYFPHFAEQFVDTVGNGGVEYAVVDAFGPDRELFGSNWPLSDMLGSFKGMIRMLDD